MSLMSQRVALDIEELVINGDKSIASDTDDFLSVFGDKTTNWCRTGSRASIVVVWSVSISPEELADSCSVNSLWLYQNR